MCSAWRPRAHSSPSTAATVFTRGWSRPGGPLTVADAATCLFALRSAPAALMRQLVDEVVRGDARFAWRSGTEIALAEWEDAGSLLDAPLERADYVVFDLETTGTRPGSARIVEVGAVRIVGARAGGAVRAAGRSGRPDPADDHRAHRDLARARARAAAHRPRARRLPALLRRRRAGRAQRPLRRRVRRRRAAPAARRPAGGAGDRHGRARPPAAGRPAAAHETWGRWPSGSTPRCGRATGRCPTPRPPPRCWCSCWGWRRSAAPPRSAR